MVTDMLGGQVDMGFINMGQAREMEKSGRMRTLAVVGTQRSEFLPDVATFAEQGYKNLDWSYGVAVYSSTKLPAPILKTLQEAGRQVMEDPEVQKAYRAQSNQPWLKISPEDLRKRLAQDSENWSKVLNDIGNIE
jgi:tripartite-type tricarboxylate transporter receptor subunit TctC